MNISTDVLISVGQFVAAIAILILIHETGHYLAARLLGIEVEEFGIGFPPRITTLFRAGGTEFTLNWLPFGGFVRPKGENDASVPDGLAAASPWKRLTVLAAGPLMNILAGVLLYAVIFTRIGAPDTSQVIVIEVAPDSPAEEAGLQSGDIITRVEGTPISNTQQVHEIIYSHLGKSLEMEFTRGDRQMSIHLTPRVNPPPEGAIGILMGNPVKPVTFFAALPRGVTTSFEHMAVILTMPVRILQGEIQADQARLVGFKGMYDLYQNARQVDAQAEAAPGVNSLAFFTTITISLAVLNLLPFPALDGGRILLILPEIVLRRRIPQKYENLINFVGLALLILLMFYINIQDFVNPPQIR